MKFLATLILAAAAFISHSQSVLVMDFVKVKNGRYAEAMYYYQNNWKKFRDIALEKGYIQSYRMDQTTADSIAAFDLVLITEYKDSLQHKKSEENFREIISADSRNNGPKLLNELKPADFRQNVFVKVTETIYKSKGRRNGKKNKLQTRFQD